MNVLFRVLRFDYFDALFLPIGRVSVSSAPRRRPTDQLLLWIQLHHGLVMMAGTVVVVLLEI